MQIGHVRHQLDAPSAAPLPQEPATVHDIDRCLKAERRNGWTLNYYGQLRVEHAQKILQLEDGSLKAILTRGQRSEIEDRMPTNVFCCFIFNCLWWCVVCCSSSLFLSAAATEAT